MRSKTWTMTAVLTCAWAIAGCDGGTTPATVAPSATALQQTREAAAGAQRFEVASDSTKAAFLMDAPQEKIHGDVDKAMTGTIDVDLTDITKTTAHLFVDLDKLVIAQQREKDGELGDKTVIDAQNEHAREWLEIGNCEADGVEDKAKCEEATKVNKKVEFVISKITDAKPGTDITKMTGDERKVTFTATGPFLLHGKKKDMSAEVEAVFKFEGGKPKSVTVKTVKPMAVGLAEFDVRPRDAFGKIASKTLEVLAPKVAKDAAVSLELTASHKGDTPGTAATAAPAATATAAAPTPAPGY